MSVFRGLYNSISKPFQRRRSVVSPVSDVKDSWFNQSVFPFTLERQASGANLPQPQAQ